MKEKQVLKSLRSRYEKRYVTPLVEKFPKPLVLFDDKQIRLKKQIDSLISRIDSSEICPECNGRGVVFEENSHSLKENPSWDYPWNENHIDQRAIKNDRCTRCFGDGIVFTEQKDKFGRSLLIAQNGMSVHSSRMEELVCDFCHQKLLWTFIDDEAEPYFESTCHDRSYLLKCKIFSVSVIRDAARGTQGLKCE